VPRLNTGRLVWRIQLLLASSSTTLTAGVLLPSAFCVFPHTEAIYVLLGLTIIMSDFGYPELRSIVPGMCIFIDFNPLCDTLSRIGELLPWRTNVQLMGYIVPFSKPGFNTRFFPGTFKTTGEPIVFRAPSDLPHEWVYFEIIFHMHF